MIVYDLKQILAPKINFDPKKIFHYMHATSIDACSIITEFAKKK